MKARQLQIPGTQRRGRPTIFSAEDQKKKAIRRANRSRKRAQAVARESAKLVEMVRLAAILDDPDWPKLRKTLIRQVSAIDDVREGVLR